MNIIITGHDLDLTKHNKHFIEKKVHDKLVHFMERLHNIHVVIRRQKYLFIVDCEITSDFGTFFSSYETEMFEKTVDESLDRVLSEIRKKHDKLLKH